MPSAYFRTEKLNFKKYYNANHKNLENAKNTLLSVISSILAEENLEVYAISGRIKNREECIKKFTRKYKAKLEEEQVEYQIKDYVKDLIGLRIIMLYEPDINRVGELLQNEFKVLEKTDKSRQLEQKENIFGYKGLHLDLKFDETRANMREYRPFADFSFEVQIRTIIQDAWSVLDHRIKYKKAIPRYLERRINSLAALFEIADQEFLDIHLANKAEEEKAKATQNTNDNINVFTFNRLMEETMPDYMPQESHLGEYVDHLLSYGDLSYDDLKIMVIDHFETVQQFFKDIQQQLGRNFNPDALIYLPHILYLAKPQKYQMMLPGFSKKIFKDWISEQHSLVNQQDVDLTEKTPDSFSIQ